MTSHNRQRRSSVPTQTFTALEPGELGVNTANRQMSVGDADGASLGVPLPMLGVRVFDARGMYVTGDFVVNGGILYRAKFATGPGSLDALAWEIVAGPGTGASPYVLRAGDTMSGPLNLPTGPVAAAHAVRKDYVDSALVPYATTASVTAAIAPLATINYVDTQDAKAVLKTGSTMTGALTLPGDPTTGLHASTKTYVDNKVASFVGVPPGAIMDFAMPAAPAGWLPCDGYELNRADYPALFAAIGTTWGAGNGSTTFLLPNLTTRFRRHRDNSPDYAGAVGNRQSPCNLSHYHGININSGYISNDHTHYTSGTTGAADRALNHAHSGIPDKTGVVTFGTGQNVSSGYTYVSYTNHNTGSEPSPDHLHGFGAWSGGVNSNHYHNVAGNTGGGSADSGVEARPYCATVLTCIKV